MLRSWIRNVALITALALMAPGVVQAQTLLYGGGGALLPVSDFDLTSDPGFVAVGGVMFPVGRGALSVGAEALYGKASSSGDRPSKDINGLMAYAETTFGEEGGPQPFLFGGVGMLRFDSDASETSKTSFGYQGGGGLSLAIGGIMSVWVEGRYVSASPASALTPTFVSFMVGASISLGG
jgi:opacity protein-like surface antigen